MMDAVSLLALPFAGAVAFVMIHAYFGIHVLRRKIVFADLALAQLAALGATLAFANGYSTTSTAGFAYALLFAGAGAAVLTCTRNLSRVVSQEAFIGIVYVVATAATILVIDQAPQGAEHVKKMLNGTLLTVDVSDVARLVALYAAIAAVHWLIRRPIVALSIDASRDASPVRAAWFWDFAFFASFAIVVTSSVTTAGVLLVFSLLIVPPIIGSLFASTMQRTLCIAWIGGVAACAAGLAGSYAFELPTGATIVTSLALLLVLAGIARTFVLADRQARRRRFASAAKVVSAVALLIVLVSSVWLIVTPAADQPILAIAERVSNVGPANFLNARDAETYESAARDAVRFQAEADRLGAREKEARQGAPLPDDEIRRIASYQQNFNEMARGERFVQDVLRAKARARERWLIGMPAAIIALLALAALARSFDGRRGVSRTGANRRRHGVDTIAS